MSGGVDSSVSAYLLKQQGWNVIGVFMKNWEDTVENPQYRDTGVNGCNWEQDYADVRAVCHQLDIPYVTYNFVKEYHDAVFTSFIKELKKGRTPNPDIVCNQEIKFQLFLQKAFRQEGVEAVATGHYAKISNGHLCRPKDKNKDQTYFLYRINPKYFGKIQFPLADLTKEKVRSIAHELGFRNANKKDSTGICFIGDIDYQSFINEHIKKNPGEIQTLNSVVVGTHDGLHLFTIGQRKGISIGGKGPYYVVQKNIKKNILFVSNNPKDPALYQNSCVVQDIHWLSEVKLPLSCLVQIRYRQAPQIAKIEYTNTTEVQVDFLKQQRAITPGQSAVFYLNDCVIGGGVIA